MIEEVKFRVRHECSTPSQAIYEFMAFLKENREHIVHHNMMRKRCVIGDVEHLFVAPGDPVIQPCSKKTLSDA